MHCLHQIEWLHIKAKHKESYIFILVTLHDLTFFKTLSSTFSYLLKFSYRIEPSFKTTMTCVGKEDI